jgi:hypothetical protein
MQYRWLLHVSRLVKGESDRNRVSFSRSGYLDELTIAEIEVGASGVKRFKDLQTFSVGL